MSFLLALGYSALPYSSAFSFLSSTPTVVLFKGSKRVYARLTLSGTEAPNEMNPTTKMQRGEMICPRGPSKDVEALDQSHVLRFSFLGHYLFIIYSFIYFGLGLPWGKAMFPCDLTSPWQCFGNKLDSHGSPNGGRVPMSGKVFFIMKKKQK